MSDIDFDELDRAVNGVLGGSDVPTPVSTPVVETPVVSEAPTITHIERTTLSPVSSKPTLTPAPAPVANAVPVSSAPAARRSSGRFMDMVHPSSDMRSRTTGSIPSTPTPERAPERVTEVTPQPVTAEIPESPAWNEPLESPFLPDAKVEKRPLGGGDTSVAEATNIIEEFDFQGLLDEPDEVLLEAPEPQERLEATTMPDPIDFAEANAVNVNTEPEIAEVVEPVKVEEAPIVPEAIVEEPQLIVEAPKPVAEEPIGPTSITPQYKEQPSANQASGAMYDTESYHQAVTPPVKKKSGWFTVIWILLLVILGAGGGWAVYTYVLPML